MKRTQSGCYINLNIANTICNGRQHMEHTHIEIASNADSMYITAVPCHKQSSSSRQVINCKLYQIKKCTQNVEVSAPEQQPCSANPALTVLTSLIWGLYQRCHCQNIAKKNSCITHQIIALPEGTRLLTGRLEQCTTRVQQL